VYHIQIPSDFLVSTTNTGDTTPHV
jgi:hypothetical protein